MLDKYWIMEVIINDNNCNNRGGQGWYNLRKDPFLASSCECKQMIMSWVFSIT